MTRLEWLCQEYPDAIVLIAWVVLVPTITLMATAFIVGLGVVGTLIG